MKQPILQDIDENKYLLVRPYVYYFSGVRIIVPAGFTTDLASVPRALWSIIPRDGLACGPAVIHDYLYTNTNGFILYGWDRSICDRVLLQALLDAGCSKIKAYAMYYAVKMFGGKYWTP